MGAKHKASMWATSTPAPNYVPSQASRRSLDQKLMTWAAVIENLHSRRALDRALDRALAVETEIKAANRERSIRYPAANHVPSQASRSSLDQRFEVGDEVARRAEAEVEDTAEAESAGSSAFNFHSILRL